LLSAPFLPHPQSILQVTTSPQNLPAGNVLSQDALTEALGDRGLTVTFIDRDAAGPSGAPQVMTMHRAKGMEFAKVVLIGVGAKSLPRKYIIDGLPEGDRADALRRERSLLYVAATRARDELVVVYAGAPSELLPVPASESLK
ncbi:3'-5' exonuclease, partial [Rhodococcus sp. NPDC058532]|uniref:3'-5' exonuclease n=1 Tax=Rhodococcus sp. NPDC058532 TaxID=3346540 RepID=UPI00366342E7